MTQHRDNTSPEFRVHNLFRMTDEIKKIKRWLKLSKTLDGKLRKTGLWVWGGRSLILWISFVNFQIYQLSSQTLCYQVGWRFWNPLAIQHVWCRMLTYVDVSDMSDGCGVSEILLQSSTYADVCWRMLTCLTETVLAVSLSTLSSSFTLWQARMLTYADVYGHMLTYADVWRRLHPHQTSWDDN